MKLIDRIKHAVLRAQRRARLHWRRLDIESGLKWVNEEIQDLRAYGGPEDEVYLQQLTHSRDRLTQERTQVLAELRS